MKTSRFRVAIIDDDPGQLAIVSKLLRTYEDEFEIVGVAGDIKSGRKLLEELRPDLAILDVVLPPHDCFELLMSLKSISFKIIFTTSHDAFAVRAFRMSAIDYLLKPVDSAEFRQAIEKFKGRTVEEEGSSRVSNLLSNMQAMEADHARVALPTLSGFYYVPIRDVVRCESDNTYTVFFTINRKKIVVSRSLKECESLLDDFGFFRVHNSHLVNLKYVVEYIKGEGGLVRMADGSSVDVSRRRKEEFLRQLNTL